MPQHWLGFLTTYFIVRSAIPSVKATSPPNLLLVPRDAPVHDVPLRLWANPRQAVLRPRKRDLQQSALMATLEPHFDPDWMSTSKPHKPPSDISHTRKSAAELKSTASTLGLSDTVRDWLVSRGTCPITYAWKDLGSDFWPRWVRTAVCLRPATGTCSWPPGMGCVSAPPRHLHVLRWHCRLKKKNKRKKVDENNVWGRIEKKEVLPKKKGRRKRYRCLWVKVPYPVPEDCICACA
ncbi:noggin [Nesidiocoris tenuis]|uniref:Noggin n=1 Tax=Nesidiocoris tenuis TaxID=355587 RepID=A0ABN7BGW2_9HEMI|nr:noggin [Nesidiocoris tenuis]